MTWTEAAALWEALDGYAWPVVVGGALIGFRQRLGGLIDRIRMVKGAGIELEAEAVKDQAHRAGSAIQEAQQQAGQDAASLPPPASSDGLADRRPADRVRQAWWRTEEELRGLVAEALGVAYEDTPFDMTEALDFVLARLGGVVPFEVSLSILNLAALHRSVEGGTADLTSEAAEEFEVAAWRARSFLNFIRRKKLYDPPHGGLTVS